MLTCALVTSNDLLEFYLYNLNNLLQDLVVLCLTSFIPVFVFTQAAKRGLLSPGRGRGVHVRGRGGLRARGRGSRGRGRGMPVHAFVDHRPRALEISGFTEADRVDLLPHFAVSLQITTLLRKGDLTSTIEPL